MDTNLLGTLLRISTAIGASLTDFSSYGTAADSHLKRFANLINEFSGAWRNVDQALRVAKQGPTEALLQLLNKMIRDCCQIMDYLRLAIQALDDQLETREVRAEQKWFSTSSCTKKLQGHDFEHFLGRGAVVLHRSQTTFTTSLLNIILTVVENATNSSDMSQPPGLIGRREVQLINNFNQARLQVRRITGSHPAATPQVLSWVGRLDLGPRPVSTLFEDLTFQWIARPRQPSEHTFGDHSRSDSDFSRHDVSQHDVNINVAVEQRFAQQEVHFREILQTSIQPLQDRIQELEEQSRSYQQQIRQLEDRCRSLQVENRNQKQHIKSVEQKNAVLKRENVAQEREHQVAIQALTEDLRRVRRERNRLRRRTDQLEPNATLPPTSWRVNRKESDSDSGVSTGRRRSR